MSAEIKCAECGWHWKLAKGGKDPYTCHNCGHKTPPMPNELHRMDHDAHDEHHQLRADVEERLGDKGENPCWRGYHPVGLKPNGDPNCVPIDETDSFCTECLMEYLTENWGKLEEAEYRGRKVTLGKPFLTPGGPKKRSVYVKNAKGNVVKVNFGDPNMKIKKNIPARRKSYRARHHCDNPGPRWKANYWSCKAW